jgi:hypothetical protein
MPDLIKTADVQGLDATLATTTAQAIAFAVAL